MLKINRINRMCFEYTKKWNNTNYKFAFLQEEIVYHMRRVVDDMISIVWIQNQMESQQNRLYEYEFNSGYMYDHDNLILRLEDDDTMQEKYFIAEKEIK